MVTESGPSAVDEVKHLLIWVIRLVKYGCHGQKICEMKISWINFSYDTPPV